MKTVAVAVLLCALAILVGVQPASAQVPAFEHVFTIVFENEEATDVIGNPSAPYLNQLANTYGLATNAYAVTHPSLPNYMALTSGTTAFTDDCIGCLTTAPSIADRLEAAGRSWTAYMEDLPGGCGTSDSGLYVAKHNPFAHYANIAGNATRCAGHIAPFSRFLPDLWANTLASYVWITPNLCNDMHDCSIATGDAWLASIAPQILSSPAFANSVLIVIFDEGTSTTNGGGQIPLVIASPWTPAGFRSSTPVDHYSVLRTIEDAWSLAPLGASASATAMSEFFPASAPVSAAEQVVYATDATIVGAGWSKVSDPTAASFTKLASPDLGAAAIGAPLANPSSYVEADFTANAGTRYRVWLRMHARADSKWNDSVFVQFSDSVDAQGSAIYRIGTSGGYVVNLWTCATCQSFGWGWQRNAYWLADSGDVWFPARGTHRIRIQVREDGVEIDQIVISSSQYASNPPGPVSDDSTIVPKAGGGPPPPSPPPPSPPPPSPPPPPSGGSTPHTGMPFAIPGTITAADFDDGGEDVAYHDTTPGNNGGAYRVTDDVDLQPSSEGGFNVGWVAPGEWLNYSVAVAAGGSYTVTFRVASPGGGGSFHLEMNGADMTGAITIPVTDDWQVWQDVTRTVTLAAGAQIAKVVMDAPGTGSSSVGNFLSIGFVAASSSFPSSTPFSGSPIPLPGVIEAEQFDNGGEGVAYHDLSPGNSGGWYRSTDVDIEPASSGGFDVGWVSAEEWLNYTVNVTSAGTYTFVFRVASSGAGGTFHVETNRVDVSGAIAVPDTGDWQAWRTITRSIALNAGVQQLRLVMDTPGVNAVGNFDSIAVQ
jgi:acid phosphatase